MLVRRRDDVVVQQVEGESMLFDPVSRQFHLLNPVAAFVYAEAVDATDMGALVSRATSVLGAEVTVLELETALAELERAGVLQVDEPATESGPLVSRRAAVLRLGALAIGGAFVTSLAAPSPLAAQSGATTGAFQPPAPPPPPPPLPPEAGPKPKKDK